MYFMVRVRLSLFPYLKTDLEAAVVSVAAVHVDPALEAEEEAAEEEAK